ncbi:MAG: DUF3575 domain-containing protein [Bacteroides sp.]
MNRSIITYLFILFSGVQIGFAQHIDSVATSDGLQGMRFHIYYPVNQIQVDTSYMDNPINLKEIDTYLARSPWIDSIVIYSYASPEGSYRRNQYLAAKRGAAAKQYILSRVPEGRHFPDTLIHLRPEAENWGGLREEVWNGYHRTDRSEVLAILDSDLPDEQKKRRLKRLNHGITWQYLLKHHMPHLRYATWVSVWGELPKEEILLPEPVSYRMPDATRFPTDLLAPCYELPEREEYDTRTVVAIKSNLLYDAVTWLNFAIEVPLYDERFSLLYYHQFPWWRGGEHNNKYCMRFLGIGGEARWWFRPMPRPADERHVKRDKLMGHFLGLYGQGGKWDFERKRKYCYQGEFWSAGLTYGYAMPIGRRLNLEFSLSVGYASIPYRHYVPTEDYSLLIRDRDKTGTWHYVGPTKAEVALVLPILMKYKKKGGNR